MTPGPRVFPVIRRVRTRWGGGERPRFRLVRVLTDVPNESDAVIRDVLRPMDHAEVPDGREDKLPILARGRLSQFLPPRQSISLLLL